MVWDVPAAGAQPAYSRSGGTALEFGGVWPRARARVAGMLSGRGVQAADVDDIVQEVAIRALRNRDRFASEEHLVRWCCRVAINLHIDAVRRARRLGPPVAGDTPGPHDTARDAERRIALDQLASSIAELSLEEQQLLFDTTPAGSRRETVRLAVRRHRLRARLAAMVDGLAAAVAVVRRLPRTMSTPAKLAAA